MNVKTFFDEDTSTFTYLITDPQTLHCAVIDPVLNLDLPSGKTSTTSADEVIQHIQDQKLTLEWILETHIHADHLTAAHYLQETLGGKIAIHENIQKVLAYWAPLFSLKLSLENFDHLFHDHETFHIGKLSATVIPTPGHTPACSSYHINDHVFVGDSIFMPHLGSARADFPGGSAKVLYHSIQRILALPEQTKIHVCHDYPEANEPIGSFATVKEQKMHNSLAKLSEEEFIRERNRRDKGKAAPTLLLPSLQVNLVTGNLKALEENGISYLKIPLNQL